MPIVPIVQPVYHSETFYTEYFHCIPICSKISFFKHHVIDSTVKHKDTFISNITRLVANIFLNASFMTNSKDLIPDIARHTLSALQRTLR